jgi:hypothetical protein
MVPPVEFLGLRGLLHCDPGGAPLSVFRRAKVAQ